MKGVPLALMKSSFIVRNYARTYERVKAGAADLRGAETIMLLCCHGTGAKQADPVWAMNFRSGSGGDVPSTATPDVQG
jgi:hypothetical protein